MTRYHAIVRQLKDGGERHEVSRAALPRALRVVHALAAEAERRGYEVKLPSDVRDSYGRESWSGRKDGHLVITANGYTASIRVSEEGLPSRSYWDRQNWSYSNGGPSTRRSASARKEYESGATGRLCLELLGGGGQSVRPSKWADRRSWMLEDKLPDLLHEIEIRAVEKEQRLQAAEREAAEGRRAWEAAKIRARDRYVESRRVDVLFEQIANWEKAEQIRTYCDAAESAHPDVAQTRTWIAWARQRADEMDSLRIPPQAPAVPRDVTAEQLKPFLDGWDPYEPRKGADGDPETTKYIAASRSALLPRECGR